MKPTLSVLACLVLTLPTLAQIPDLRGSYLGHFADPAKRTLHTATLPNMSQVNSRQLSGQLDVEGFNLVNFTGVINSNNLCTCFGGGANPGFTFQARWEKLGSGAGAVFGTANLTQATGKNRGTLFLFRGMTPTTGTKPPVVGSYAGTISGGGTVTTQITDGTSNTFHMALRLQQATTNDFAMLGDVGVDGTVVAIGVNGAGNIAIVRGYIEQDNLRGTRQLVATVQIKTPGGVTLSTNSIIAILIG